MASSPPPESPHVAPVGAQGSGHRWALIDTEDANSIQEILLTSATPWDGVEQVPKDKAQAVMDTLQTEVDMIAPGDLEIRKKYVKCILKLSKGYSIVPTQFYIPKAALQNRDDDYTHYGSFSDVYGGTIHGHPDRVCLKRLRIGPTPVEQDPNLKKAFCREALTWRQVSHENVLPFYGVSNEMFGTPVKSWLCFISPWIDNGTVLDFLGTHPGHDLRGWVWDVSAGLNYLHQLDPCIVHKDIRGKNLLVGEDHRCYIADFGISIVIETIMPGTNTRGAGTLHWKPLEVLTNSPPSDKSLMPKVDIYSFGCTIVEMFTGQPPYKALNVKTETELVEKLKEEELPPRPDILPPELWNTIVKPALSPSPKSRPSAAKVMDDLRALYGEFINDYLAKRSPGVGPLRILEWTVVETANS